MMRQHRLSQAAAGDGLRVRVLPWLLLSALLYSCGGDGSSGSGSGPLVKVHPVPLDPSVTQVLLTVTATDPTGMTGKPNMTTFTSGPFDSLGVTFPLGTRGLTTYQVTANSSPTCGVSAGMGILNLDSDGVFDLSVAMTATPMCGNAATVSVQIASVGGATGSVTSMPAGINCTGSGAGCSGVFTKGTSITLTAQPTNFVGWAGGNCSGTGPCTFTLSQDVAIQAIFSTCKGWCKEQLPAGVTANLNAISGTASNNILVVGDLGTAVLWNGSAWAQVPLPQNATTNLYAATAKPMGNIIYVAGDGGTILGLMGTTFQPIMSPTTVSLRAAGIGHGTNPYTYFVGDGGTGLALPPAVTTATGKLSGGAAIYAISQNPNATKNEDLYLVGAQSAGSGFAASWDGNTGLSAQMTFPGAYIAGDIHAMVCGLANHYAAGAGGAIVYRSSGNNQAGNWKTTASGVTTQTLRGLWESSDTNVLAVGDGGTILQFNGTTWTAPTSNTTVTLRAVFGTSATNIYAVGDNGTVLHYLP